MTVTATPTITIDGQRLECAANAARTKPVAVEGLQITWGRGDYYEGSTNPSTAQFTIFDASHRWAWLITTHDAIGTPVEITVDITDRFTTSMVVFRGTIARIQAKPTKARPEGSDKHGWAITITAADRTAALGNIHISEEWPREHMFERLRRIQQAANDGNANIALFEMPREVNAAWVAPMKYDGTSLLDIVDQAYKTNDALTWTYDHASNFVRPAFRLTANSLRRFVNYDASGAVYMANEAIEDNGVRYPSIGLGGCRIASDCEIEVDATTKINRAEVTWLNSAHEHESWVSSRQVRDTNKPRRVLKWSSWFDEASKIDASRARVFERVKAEGNLPRHPIITTEWTTDFLREKRARWLLTAHENLRTAFIVGDLPAWWLRPVGRAPLVAPIGGQIRYDVERGWQIQLTVHWVWNTYDQASRKPVTYADLLQRKYNGTMDGQPGIGLDGPWWHGPMPNAIKSGQRTPLRDIQYGPADGESGYRFSDSLKWTDLQYLTVGGAPIVDDR